jgi:hypothetical protein
MDADAVAGGVLAHEFEGVGEVGLVAVGALALIAALGDGVEVAGAEVPWRSHGGLGVVKCSC